MITLIRQNSLLDIVILVVVINMKRKFITRKTKRKKHWGFFSFLMVFGITLYVTFRFFDRGNIKINDKVLAKILVNIAFTNDGNSKRYSIGKLNPAIFLKNNYHKYIARNTEPTITEEKPLIYIYNSHQTEEYKPTNFAEFSVVPTVVVGDYILEDIFNKNNLKTLVEEGSVKSILNQNGWIYSYSYMASRILMENAKANNPSLKYFIDVHRDSLTRDRTTIAIDGKDYAKTIFLIGLENANYEENLDFTNRINDKLNEKYPGLSKGIYKKGGVGVNGVYNQDFSNRVILIEVGGYENSLTEVLNSLIAFSECFMEVINEEI